MCVCVFTLSIYFKRSLLKQVNLLLQGKDNQITKSTGRCTHTDSHLGLVKVDSIHRQLFCILKEFQVCLGWSHGSGEREKGLSILLTVALRRGQIPLHITIYSLDFPLISIQTDLCPDDELSCSESTDLCFETSS